MKTVKLTQIKSQIDRPLRQKKTLEALKLGKINKSAQFELTPQIAGMIAKVNHLIRVEEV